MDMAARSTILQQVQDAASREGYSFGPHEKTAMKGQTTWVWPCPGGRRVEITVGGPLVHAHFIGTDREGHESDSNGPSREYAERLGRRIAVFAATAAAADAPST
jgi:hypothetical protein